MFSKLPKLRPRHCAVAFFASAFQAFGMYNIHALSGVTEGGIFGLILLLNHWLGLSPAFSSLILNGGCYLLGWKTLGKEFIGYSVVATLGYSACYRICEQFPPLWPGIAELPLLASVAGALFIGIGAGLCVHQRRRCPGYESDPPDGDSHSAAVSHQRSDRAFAVAKLHSPPAHRLFPADGDSLRADHRLDAEGKKVKAALQH